MRQLQNKNQNNPAILADQKQGTAHHASMLCAEAGEWDLPKTPQISDHSGVVLQSQHGGESQLAVPQIEFPEDQSAIRCLWQQSEVGRVTESHEYIDRCFQQTLTKKTQEAVGLSAIGTQPPPMPLFSRAVDFEIDDSQLARDRVSAIYAQDEQAKWTATFQIIEWTVSDQARKEMISSN